MARSSPSVSTRKTGKPFQRHSKFTIFANAMKVLGKRKSILRYSCAPQNA
ncbi:hypothetical protein HMPREF9413_2919 [Paenibacillus sp. HGF7]|nr:hypothetical protein HMPREF9413_2919 [Paenibacillus sp. HGF7]